MQTHVRAPRCIDWLDVGLSLQQFPEFLNREASVSNNPAHRYRIDWVVAWYGHNPNPVTHDNMFALADDAEACLLQGSNRVEVIDANGIKLSDCGDHVSVARASARA